MSDNLQPFSNGSQYADWQMSNCERCKKYNPAKASPEACEIDYAIGSAYLGDGAVSEDIARRMGYTDHRDAYNWPCGEVEWTEAWKADRMQARIVRLEAIIIEADAQFTVGNQPEDIETACLGLVSMCSIARDVMDHSGTWEARQP